MSEPLVSIVIASYNTRDLTDRCLAAVRAGTTLPHEVIVVDNGSADGSPEMISERHPHVRLIRNSENLGFAAAQNLGLAAAEGRALLVLNSDVLVEAGAIDGLCARLSSLGPSAGMIGPQVLNADGTVAPSARRARLARSVVVLGVVNRHFGFKRWLPEQAMRRWLGGVFGRWHDNYRSHAEAARVDFVDGMCVLVRREALESAGLFDEQFFFDWEIVDLADRVRAAGFEVHFYPDVRVVHLGHASRKLASKILVETHRSQLIYYAKHAPDQLPLLLRSMRAVVAVKLLTLRARAAVRPRAPRGHEIEVCRDILALCRGFDGRAAAVGTRIPRLCRKTAGREVTCERW
jgi:GT2 family glycosyltransferase